MKDREQNELELLKGQIVVFDEFSTKSPIFMSPESGAGIALVKPDGRLTTKHHFPVKKDFFAIFNPLTRLFTFSWFCKNIFKIHFPEIQVSPHDLERGI